MSAVTAVESGVDASVQNKFPGSTVQYGSAASGAGGNRDIPVEEGGDVDARGRYVRSILFLFSLSFISSSSTKLKLSVHRLSKAKHFEGDGGPETKAAQIAEANPGSDSVRENVRPSGGDQKVHD